MRPWPECPRSLRARMFRTPATNLPRCGSFRRRWSQSLLPEFPFALVEVPKLASCDDFLKVFRAAWRTRQILSQRGIQPCNIVRGRFLDHRVGTQSRELSSDETFRLIKRVGECVAGIAAHH